MIALRFVQRQDDGDSRSDIGEENGNQQADKPLEVAVDSIFDVCHAIFDVCHAILEARQPMVNLLNDRFQNGDSAFNGGYVHHVSFYDDIVVCRGGSPPVYR